MSQFNSVSRWARKLATRSLLLAGATALLVPLAVAPLASAQITIGVGVIRPSAPTATTTIPRTVARPWAFMGRAISTTASSWVLARGLTGATATDGAVIASLLAEAEGTEAKDTSTPTETPVDTAIRSTTHTAHRQCTPFTVTAAPMPNQRMAARPTLRLIPHPHTLAHLTVANTTRNYLVNLNHLWEGHGFERSLP